MKRPREIPFGKFHALGNDWIVVAGRDLSWCRSDGALAAVARRVLDRHAGIGADGLITLLPPRNKAHDARVRFFNADGSEAEMSGNGIRCAAAFLETRGARLKGALETISGVKGLERIEAAEGGWVFRVSMGRPILEPARIPFKAPDARAPLVGFPLETQRGPLRITVISMGNPHCTVFVNDFATDWAGIGREIETNPLFPRRTNVEFVRVISRNEIEARFWERGVGATQSSGTGSCAAVVACILNGLTGRDVRVRTWAGDLKVTWPEDAEVTLTGPVVRVAEGQYYYNA